VRWCGRPWECWSSPRRPSIDDERWVPLVREADVLLTAGGDAFYLCHWMRQSGLADLLPSLRETVWVGLSAGSMVMTPRIGEDLGDWKPPGGSDSTLGIVDFSRGRSCSRPLRTIIAGDRSRKSVRRRARYAPRRGCFTAVAHRFYEVPARRRSSGSTTTSFPARFARKGASGSTRSRSTRRPSGERSGSGLPSSMTIARIAPIAACGIGVLTGSSSKTASRGQFFVVPGTEDFARLQP
jgi:Peptidase family S51